MNRRNLEALAEAITHYSGYLDPTSPLYHARNPIGLRPVKPEQPRDSHGFRIFRSMLDGMQAAIFDLEFKVVKHRMSPESTLTDLALAYGRKATEAVAWAKFLRQALLDEAISHRTMIKQLLEK